MGKQSVCFYILKLTHGCLQNWGALLEKKISFANKRTNKHTSLYLIKMVSVQLHDYYLAL